VPKDAPGQHAGVPWREDAIYDLGLAAKEGGSGAVAASTVATKLLLPEKVDRPYLVREVGPTLLAVPPVQSQIPDTIRYWLRGRLASWLWRPIIADSAFSAYLAAGGSPDRSALELARLRLATAGAPGDSLYYRAAASTDPWVVRQLRYDVALIADTVELRSFDSLPAAGRPAWLRSFWEQRDLESLHERGTRLREHYARIGLARERFRILSYPRQYELNELWINRDAEYDDRGLVYIRHGEPDTTVSAVRTGACPNTSWLYRRPDGNLIFHFVARQNPDDWRIVETLANVAGQSGATTTLRQAGSAQSCGMIDDLLETRRTLDPIYNQLTGNQSRMNWERELAITTRSRGIGTTTDSDLLRFPSSLNTAWRAYGLLGSGPGTGRVLVVTSVPATTLVPISEEPLAYGFRTRMVARSGSRTVEIDSVRRLGVHQAPEPGQMVTFTTEVPLASGTWNLGMALQQPADSAGEILRDNDVPVPDVASQALSLSDIVLGEETGGRPWDAPDGPFPLTSTGTYVQGERIPIYYELSGARSGSEIQSEITLVRDDGKGKSVIRFGERVDGPIARVRREVNTSKSKPGRYSLSVKISAPDGRKAERETTLLVVDKKPKH
jgi:GWxTD domain-containing protein